MIQVKGTIKDKTTGETLPQANVYFSDRHGNILPSHEGTATDLNGLYEIEGNGAYITASYVGYAKKTKPFKSILNFELESGVELKGIVISAKYNEIPEAKSNNKLIIGVAVGFVVLVSLLLYFKFKP